MAALVLLSSLIALVYVWRVIEVAYFKEPAAAQEHVREAPLGMLVPTCVLIGATIYFGVWTRLPTAVARRAAEYLLGVTS